MRTFRFFFLPVWRQILIATLLSALIAFSNVIVLKLLKSIIEADSNPSIAMMGILVLISLSMILNYFVGGYVTNFFASKISSYRKELAEKVLDADYQHIESRKERIIPILLFEINSIGGFGQIIPQFLLSIFQIVIIVGYLFYSAWEIALTVSAIFFGTTLLSLFTMNVFKQTEKKLSEVRFSVHYLLDGLVKGLKDLSLNEDHRKYFATKLIAKPSDQQAFYTTKLFLQKTLLSDSIRGIAILGFVCVLMLVGNRYGADAQVIVEFLALLVYLIPSFNGVVEFFKKMKGVENALDQIEELKIDLKTDISTEANQIDFKKDVSTDSLIRFEKVVFNYQEGGAFSIGPINLTIKKGEVLWFQGGNGSGKTTLLKVISGLYKPVEGKQFFEEVEVSDEFRNSYRNKFSAVFSDSHLFENLGFLKEEEVLNEADKISKLLEIDHKISLSGELVVSNISLSQGQIGRLNLMRALLENKDIFLFDEWAANQDIHFKEKFYREIIPYLREQGKTVIIISHDDKYFSVADTVVTLQEGKIKKVR